MSDPRLPALLQSIHLQLGEARLLAELGQLLRPQDRDALLLAQQAVSAVRQQQRRTLFAAQA